MAFDAAAVNTLYDQLVSHAEKLGVFEMVNPAEPWGQPPSGVWCALSMPGIAPVPAASGLAATSGRLEFEALIGMNVESRPSSRPDKAVLAAAAVLLAEYSGNFSLGGNVRDVDLLGSHGAPLAAVPGYITIDSHHYRVMKITIPLIVNDLWGQAA